MASYYYVLNSSSSTCDITMETTNFGCTGVFNDVLTVCYYATYVPPNSYVKFPSAKGLHVQASPNNSPMGAYDLSNLEVTINCSTGSLGVQPWGGPSAVTDAAKAPKEVQRKKPAKQAEKG